MYQLINHLWQENRQKIAERSLLNCHTKGLHSIMLLESPEQTIRLYVAEPGNKLHLNCPMLYREGMSIGFHPHHCNLTLCCVMGCFYNWTVSYAGTSTKGIPVRQYKYRSAILGQEPGFELINPSATVASTSFEKIKQGDSIHLYANVLHTVATNPFETAAWLVFEGKEDPDYEPCCFTTSHLELTPPSKDLYQKMTVNDAYQIIQSTGILSPF